MKKTRIATIATSAAMILIQPLNIAGAAMVNPAYLLDGSGNVVHNGSGECWRTGAWTQALATSPCDPVPVPVATVLVPAAPQPEPKAPEAAATTPPAPQLVLVAKPAVMQKVSFSGDALFAFNQSALTPESRSILDGLARQLQGTTYDSVKVTGNTDRIGAKKYNQQLSERRAASVMDYLVMRGVAAGKIIAVGQGETQPVTLTKDCKGRKATAKLIACLQPDRRVDIEMTGTKPLASTP